jgi:hypothetical protein
MARSNQSVGREEAVRRCRETGTWAVAADDGGPVSPVEALLVLRYVESGMWSPLGAWVAYRELPSGQFYHVALARRTTELLTRTFGNDGQRLRAALEGFPHRPLDVGDVSAAIRAIGGVEVGVVYRLGDEEFPATADLLYDRAISKVYTADEVAALATQLCVGLMRSRGVPP